MYTDKHITMDSFGAFCPSNWEEIAAYLNDKIDAILEAYGDDADYNRDCWDEIDMVWENYCRGKYEDAPETSRVDINGESIENF